MSPLPFQIQTHWLSILSLTAIAIVLLLVLFGVLRTWLGFLPSWDMQVVGSLLWLLLKATLDLGGAVSFMPSGDAS